ncbi:interleukin-6 receptor subunit beta [Cebidichthys violaceus]|uniref:interleukin-6 receptor subunit beta n=1 Tax=Cebidichthys violaceus TaxID=271503 RepID=UPI0035C9CFC7
MTDAWSPKEQLARWTVLSVLCVCSHEVTVKDSDLKPCEDDRRVCVTDPRDCGPRPPASTLETLNMSCYYQMSHSSVTCEWSQESNSHTEPDVSLVFSSEDEIIYCPVFINPAAVLNITARIKDYTMGREIWSRPHTLDLKDAIKPSQPVLLPSPLGSTEDSVNVCWRSSCDGVCRIRYRVDGAHIWTQAPDSVPAHEDQTLSYTIKDLLVSTVYRAAVACREESGFWSDWSSDVSTRTLDKAPSRPPEVCYRVEKNDSGGSFLLHLMWKDLNLRDAGGPILGYQVSYEPSKNKKKKKQQQQLQQNATEVTALLEVEEGNCSVTVAAFNAAGYGPAAHLSIDPQRRTALPSVKHLWVSSSFPAVKGLLVQWENPKVPPSVPPVSHLAVRWRSETRPSTGSRWTTVDNLTTSAVIRDVDPDESYVISVFPVYNQQCGPPQSLPASLQQGALMEAVQLKVVGVTKTTVKVVWVWQRKVGPIRVHRYSVRLRRDSESQTLSLWPDQWQHTFPDLNPNTAYSLLLLADDVSRNIIPVRTDFDEVPAVAAATPLMLLAVIVFIISILSRTLYKSYFFPPICSPQGSAIGQWLMDPNHQKTADRHVLDMEDFQVTDVLGEKSPITVCPNSEEDDLHEDASPLSILKLSALRLDTEYVPDAPVNTGHPPVSPQSYRADYPDNRRHPDAGFLSEESRDAAAALLQTPDANGRFPQRDDETPLEKETFDLCELVANGHDVHQMTCEAGYVANGCLISSDL